jgi:hypothetical protein
MNRRAFLATVAGAAVAPQVGSEHTVNFLAGDGKLWSMNGYTYSNMVCEPLTMESLQRAMAEFEELTHYYPGKVFRVDRLD